MVLCLRWWVFLPRHLSDYSSDRQVFPYETGEFSYAEGVPA